MPLPNRIRVMISSRCNDPILLDNAPATLTDLRRRIKSELEGIRFLGSQVFDVWINEDAPPDEGSADSWDACLRQVREADLILCLYNGRGGWAKQAGDIGICHAELHTCLSIAPAKVRLIELPLAEVGSDDGGARDRRFRKYVETQSLFRGAVAHNGDEAVDRCRDALREAVVQMVRLGGREARRGKFHVGDALEWSRLDFATRRDVMRRTVCDALASRSDATESDRGVVIKILGQPVLMRCDAIPAAMTVAAAREMVGQPFVRDHEIVGDLPRSVTGPVHFIACHRAATETQAVRLVGCHDATVVAPPFGIYAVDKLLKVQVILLANCRDATGTRHAVQRFWEWLEQSGEVAHLCARAKSRVRILRAVAEESAEVRPPSALPGRVRAGST